MTEFEFHISPPPSSSRPQTGVGTDATRSSTRRAVSTSTLSRRGLSTASAMSGMTPSRQRRISYRKIRNRPAQRLPTAPEATTPRSVGAPRGTGACSIHTSLPGLPRRAPRGRDRTPVGVPAGRQPTRRHGRCTGRNGRPRPTAASTGRPQRRERQPKPSTRALSGRSGCVTALVERPPRSRPYSQLGDRARPQHRGERRSSFGQPAGEIRAGADVATAADGRSLWGAAP